MAEYTLAHAPAWGTVKASVVGDGTATFWDNSFLPLWGRLCNLARFLVASGTVPTSGASLDSIGAGADGASLIGVEPKAGAGWLGGTLTAFLDYMVTAISGQETTLLTVVNTVPKYQANTAALTAGTVTISTGITVTADTKVIPILTNDITGSTNFAGLRELVSARVVGAPGVGSITIQAVGSDGAIDTDAVGTIAYVLLRTFL